MKFSYIFVKHSRHPKFVMKSHSFTEIYENHNINEMEGIIIDNYNIEYKFDNETENNEGLERLSVIMLSIQIVLGLITIVISILFLAGQLGNSGVVIVVPAVTCCLFATFNIGILAIRKFKK